MKIGCLFVFVSLAVGVHSYDSDTDNLDLDAILSNEKYQLHILHCILEKVVCVEVSQVDIDYLEEAVKTECVKCTDFQKERLGKFILSVKDRFPEGYVTFRQKYDPGNKYLDELESMLKKYVKEI